MEIPHRLVQPLLWRQSLAACPVALLIPANTPRVTPPPKIAIMVEAATGKGILMQLIMWGKISGFLGAASGF